MSTDFAAAIDYSLRKRPERGDEQFSHVSDVYKCDLEVYARRRGLPMLPHSRETLVKWAMGRAIEDEVANAIREQYPGDSSQGRRIAWNPKTDECIGLAEKEEPPEGFMVGHLDVELEDDRHVVEIKSTVFYGGKRPPEAKEHYRDQAATYAAAIKAKTFSVVVVDRSGGALASFSFDAAEYAEAMKARAIEVMDRTDSDAPFAPEPNPRQSWSCRYCGFGGCSRNQNPMKAELEAVV